MRAELVIAGCGGADVETLCDSLAHNGIWPSRVTFVEPSEREAEDAIKSALSRSALVITASACMGGAAGEDPLRKAISRAAGKRLVLQGGGDKAALLPAGARPFASEGGAPGFYIEDRGRFIVYAPCIAAGRPLPEGLAERLGRASGRFQRRRVLRCYGLEAAQARELLEGIPEGVRAEVATSPEGVDIKLRASADSPERAERVLDEACKALAARLGNDLYGTDADRMQEAAARLLILKELTIATAESCTGGLIAKRLTDVPGSSAYMDRGAVTYSNKAKEDMLGVPEQTLKDHGAVSRETAQAMAEGIRKDAKADIGLSITGIAGPTGGTPTKPVGLVYIGLATPEGVTVKGYNFPGDREAVRFATSQKALDMVRRYLMGLG